MDVSLQGIWLKSLTRGQTISRQLPSAPASFTSIGISARGTLSLGSVLAINGTFAQMSTGRLNAQIDGTASNGAAQLHVECRRDGGAGASSAGVPARSNKPQALAPRECLSV
jgi:hypothetical protein